MTVISVPLVDFVPGQVPPRLSPSHIQTVKVVVPAPKARTVMRFGGRLAGKQRYCNGIAMAEKA